MDKNGFLKDSDMASARRSDLPPPQEGGVSSHAANNVFKGPGFQNNAPIAQLTQYINGVC